MTKQEAQCQLQRCVDLHLEVGREWMRGDLNEGLNTQTAQNLMDAANAAQEVLEWFKQEEENNEN